MPAPRHSNPDHALVISDGGAASLVAVWREVARAEIERPVVPPIRIREELEAVIRGDSNKSSGGVIWPCPGLGPQARAAVERQALLSGFSLLTAEPPVRADGSGAPGQNALLLSACSLAIGRALSRVVWPIHLGHSDTHRLADVLDRANVVSHLAAIDLPRVAESGGPASIRIEVPFADVSDAQLLDLGVELDAPLPRPVRGQAGFAGGLDACWWCERTGPRPCGVCGECGRWGVAWAAFDPAGVLSVPPNENVVEHRRLASRPQPHRSGA